MRRPLHRLAAETYDLLIIGGGVNGLATAWDAALRGLKVALVEKSDYGAATSSASLKIIHGGLRYLQHADLPRMREGIRERRALMRIAPHLIDPFPFLVPTHGHGMKGKGAMRVAMALNDIISADRNRGLETERGIPRGRTISKAECLSLAPGLNPDGLTGGAIFCDGRMHNSERVTLAFGISADQQGADLANYVEVTGFHREGDRLTAALCRDVQTGADFAIRAKQFANMAGPWLNPLLRTFAPNKIPDTQSYSVGIQLMAPTVTTAEIGLAVTSHHVDPDAKVQRGGRHYFTTPWRGLTIWGTTDRLHEGPPETFRITEAEIETFITEINDALPGNSLTRAEVKNVYGGLRPIEGKNLATGSQVSRKYDIYDHANLGIQNLISLQGIKYTACRLMAEKAVDRILQKLSTSARACKTETTDLAHASRAPIPQGPIAHHLHRTHGSRATEILNAPKADLTPLGNTNITKAELNAVLHESVFHLDDILFRRTECCTAGHPGEDVLEAAADHIANALNWSETRKTNELQRVRDRIHVRPGIN